MRILSRAHRSVVSWSLFLLGTACQLGGSEEQVTTAEQSSLASTDRAELDSATIVARASLALFGAAGDSTVAVRRFERSDSGYIVQFIPKSAMKPWTPGAGTGGEGGGRVVLSVEGKVLEALRYQ